MEHNLWGEWVGIDFAGQFSDSRMIKLARNVWINDDVGEDADAENGDEAREEAEQEVR